MQQNRALLGEIEKTNQTSFIPTDVLRAHKGIAQQFKFKTRNQMQLIKILQLIVCAIRFII